MLYAPKIIYTKMVPATETHFGVPFAAIVDRANLLLHFNGTNGSTSFIDSTGRHTLGSTGTSQITTATSRFGNGALHMSGVGDVVTTEASNDFMMGTGDFTIDFWFMRPNNRTEDDLLGLTGGTHGQFIYISINTMNYFYNGVDVIAGGTVISTNVWHHAALTRSQGLVFLFVDGISQDPGGVADTNNYDNNVCAPGIDGGVGFDGWMDEVRVLKGRAIWTSDFIPPNSPYTPPPP